MPTKNPFIRDRMERKMELLKYIVKQNRNPKTMMTIERLIGMFSWKWGLRSNIINQYIEELKMAELIEEIEGIIKPTDYGKTLIEGEQ